ncbi:MAG: DEAD/DEAH box helicase [Treponema sp.]|jgi:ATP-dependent RNA helicase RhlB|nr:DEAD/DEAH box helicase [Treponema sp.]
MKFTDLNLHPDLQRGLSEAGYISCMPVQEQVLTNAFGGQDLYVQSQTGTGKTAAFLVVIFQRLLSEPLLSGKKALIMVPTRELAVQVEDEAKLLGKYLSFKIGSFYGGVGYADQQRLLKDNASILVGTPGRVLDLNASGRMNLMDIAFLVLDEADRMFDMGFYPDLRKLIKVVPPVDRRQTMLFSATLNNWVKNLAWEYTKSPHEIEIAPENVTVEEIEQILYHVPSEHKMKLLMGILEREKPESAIIFCNTKRYAEIVAKRLRLNGVPCEFIMGDLPQAKRLKIIDDVKAGKVRFLAATDVAARGLDIEGLAMVINYDLPVEQENYVHRIGRTARAGKTGKAVTLASEQDVYELPAIERYIGKKIPSETVTEKLYGEDKSEGLRIRTDYYDDSRRSDSSRRAHPSGSEARRHPGSSRERGGHGRSAESARGHAPERRDERRTPRRERMENRETQPDISALPEKDRMAYYKRKYDKSSDETQASSRGKPHSEGRAGNRRGGRREKTAAGNREEQRARENVAAKQADSRRSRRGSKAGADLRRGKPAAAAAGSGKKAGAAAPQKQGVLGRLLGFFKPKKQKE